MRTAPSAGEGVREHPGARRRGTRSVALVRSGPARTKAEAAFRRGRSSLRPGWAEAHNALGATLCRLGRHDEGIDALSVASQLLEDFALPVQPRDGVRAVPPVRRAADAFRRAAALFPRPRGVPASTSPRRLPCSAATVSGGRLAGRRPPRFRVPGPTRLRWALCRLREHREAAGAFRDALHADPGCREALGELELGVRGDRGSGGSWRRRSEEETDSSPGERRPLQPRDRPPACSGGTRRAIGSARGGGEAFRTRGERYNLGVCLFHLHRHGAAAAAFREALRIRPAYAKGWYNLGVALFETGRHGSRGRVPRSRRGSRDTRVPTSISRSVFSPFGRERQVTEGVPGGGAPAIPEHAASLFSLGILLRQQGKTRKRPRRRSGETAQAGREYARGAQQSRVALFRMSRTAEAEEFGRRPASSPSYMGAHFNLGL